MLQGSPADVLLQSCLALGPALIKDAITRSRLDESVAGLALQELLDTGQLILLEDVGIAASQWSVLKGSIDAALVAYHETYPLRRGMPREELKSRLKLLPRIFNLVIHKLALEDTLIEGDKWVALPGHIVRFSPYQQVKVDKLMEQFAASPFSPPTIKQCQVEMGEAIYSGLLEIGDLVAVSDEVVFRKSDYQRMVQQIREILQIKGQISLAEVRDQFHTSRRYAQALLEHLDTLGITIRSGDYRKLKKQNV
jgi:selenocysteine-specific elongation factor